MFTINKKSAVFALSLLASVGAHAGSISGWGFKIGSVDATINLKGVPNPTTKPTVAMVNATLDQIGFLCLNPSNYNVAPGQAAQRTVTGSSAVGIGNLTDNGQATVKLSFEVPGPFTCVNPNWTYIPHSEAAQSLTVSISWYSCTGDPKTDTEPCYDGNTLTISPKPISSVQGVCSINPVLRNSDGTVVPGQPYSCTQTSP